MRVEWINVDYNDLTISEQHEEYVSGKVNLAAVLKGELLLHEQQDDSVNIKRGSEGGIVRFMVSKKDQNQGFLKYKLF